MCFLFTHLAFFYQISLILAALGITAITAPARTPPRATTPYDDHPRGPGATAATTVTNNQPENRADRAARPASVTNAAPSTPCPTPSSAASVAYGGSPSEFPDCINDPRLVMIYGSFMGKKMLIVLLWTVFQWTLPFSVF